MWRLLPALVSSCAAGGPYLVEMGRPAPRFDLPVLNETESSMTRVDLGEAIAANKAVLLAFGASFCAPCLVEWPVLREVAAEYRPLGLLVVFVTIDREPPGIEAMRVIAKRELALSSPLIADTDGELAKRYQVDQVPQLYLIDGSGAVVWRAIGYRGSTIEELAPELERLLSPVSGRRAPQVGYADSLHLY
jgi:peroxiredoxin